MAQQYTDEMRITLFPNDKQGNEKRPDYRGTLQIDGIKYKASVWKRTSKKGDAFLSGQLEPDKTQGTQSHQSAPQHAAPAPQREQGDDVPL